MLHLFGMLPLWCNVMNAISVAIQEKQFEKPLRVFDLLDW